MRRTDSRPMPSMMQRFALLVSRLMNLGTQGHAPRVRRRLRVINLISYVAGATSVGYAAFYTVYDYDKLYVVVFANVAAVALCALVPIAHRRSAYLGGLGFALFYLGFLFFLGYYLGAGTGIILYLLLMPAVALLFFGVENLILATALTIAGAGLYLAATFLFPAEKAQVVLDQALLDGLRIASAITFCVVSLSILFYAFLQIGRAEAATEQEFRRSESLLRNILPGPIADRLKANPDDIIADSIAQATVLFADLVHFTQTSSTMAPREVVGLLNRVFTEFDALSDRYGVEKIKTIGDAYMVAGGLTTSRTDHAVAIADMALDMLAAVRRMDHGGYPLDLRIGIHTGPVAAGVIGRRKFSYDVWGDTVNTASRLESQGLPGRIQVSAETKDLLEAHFSFEPHGAIEVKGKGQLSTYFLIGRSAAAGQPAIGSGTTP